MSESPSPSTEPESQSPERIRRLADALFWERVEEARRMSPEEKLLAGEELFEYACAITMGGIRNQFPDASEEDRLKILEDRLALQDRLNRK
jgi:hypothetical protein